MSEFSFSFWGDERENGECSVPAVIPWDPPDGTHPKYKLQEQFFSALVRFLPQMRVHALQQTQIKRS